MWEKFAEEICDTLDRSLARVEKRCDNWKDFIDGKKELKDVISENTQINLKGLNDGANLFSKVNFNAIDYTKLILSSHQTIRNDDFRI